MPRREDSDQILFLERKACYGTFLLVPHVKDDAGVAVENPGHRGDTVPHPSPPAEGTQAAYYSCVSNMGTQYDTGRRLTVTGGGRRWRGEFIRVV